MEGADADDDGIDLSRTESADETESVEMSTGLVSADSLGGATSPSTSSQLAVISFDEESDSWVDSCPADTATELTSGVVDTDVEGLSETAGTLSGEDQGWAAVDRLASEDLDVGTSGTADATASEDFDSSDATDFSSSLAASTTDEGLLVVVPLLGRSEAPDDVVVLVIFDEVEATAVHVWTPCEPADDRVVVYTYSAFAVGDDLAATVDDFEVDVFVTAGAEGFDVVGVVLLAAPEDGVVLPPATDVDVVATVLLGAEDSRVVDGEELELEAVVVRLLVREAAVKDFVDGDWLLERFLDVGDLPGLGDGTEALTTDTRAAVDGFIDGATVTTPTVVVTTVVVDRVFEVVIVARAAIAPDALTVDEDGVPEVLDPDVVDLITGATTAVTTVAVVLEVPGPNPLPDTTELVRVLPTAATTEVEVPTTRAAADVPEPDFDDSEVDEIAVLVEDDCDTSEETREMLCEGAVPEEQVQTLSEVVDLVAVVTGLVMPYGRGAKQHIIWALDEDRAPPDTASSCLSIITRAAEIFSAEEFDVVRTLAGSSNLVTGTPLSPDSTDARLSTLSTGCSVVWNTSSMTA